MASQHFALWWAVFVVASLFVLATVGRIAKDSLIGALIDDRNRVSLNHFQTLMWTVIILPAFAALFVDRGLSIPQISPELLGLLGIAAASSASSGAVKSSKNIQAAAASARRGARIAQAEANFRSEVSDAEEEAARQALLLTRSAGSDPNAALEQAREEARRVFERLVSAAKRRGRLEITRAEAEPIVPDIRRSDRPQWFQMLLEDEGEGVAGGVVSVTKFQSLIMSVIAGVALVLMIATKHSLDFDLPPDFVWLLGISQGAYVGGKIPNSSPVPPSSP